MKNLIKLQDTTNDLSEIYQQIDIKFALAVEMEDSEDVHVLTEYFKCRDYLSDSIVTANTGIVMSEKYGFQYDPGDHGEWDISNSVQLALRPPSKEVAITLKGHLKLLNDLEEYYGWELTELNKVKGDTEELFLKADPRWGTSTLMISLLSFIIRALCEKGKDAADDIEKHMAYVADLGGDSQNNAALAQAIISSKMPLWSILQYHEEIHAGSNVIGRSDIDIEGDTVHKIHDYGGILRFYNHIKSYRAGAKKMKGCDSAYLLQELAWNLFQLDVAEAT